VALASAAACSDGSGRTVELSIHFRQLPNGGLGAVSTHGLHICQREHDVSWIHVTVDDVPPTDTTPREHLWSCEDLSHD
jgi:hypothetical protein